MQKWLNKLNHLWSYYEIVFDYKSFILLICQGITPDKASEYAFSENMSETLLVNCDPGWVKEELLIIKKECSGDDAMPLDTGPTELDGRPKEQDTRPIEQETKDKPGYTK